MKKGDWIRTPRFGAVKLEEIYESEDAARQDGYTEPSHYWDDPGYGILGRSIDMYHMDFAAYRK